jgi:probable selenate reductase FAD-binding subunit
VDAVIEEYFRPTSLADAMELAARPGAVILAGGTSVNADPGDARIAVDLQGLDLGGIDASEGTVRIGATVTLQEIADDPVVPPLVRHLAERELPSILRNAATLGGTIGSAESDSELLTALVALDASLDVMTVDGRRSMGPTAFWDAESTMIIVAIQIPTGGRTTVERTARTPMDRPIVCTVAHRGHDGSTRVAVGGISDRPVAVDHDGLDAVVPSGDFRGSSAYRRHLVRVLTDRALATIEAVR